MEAFAENNSIGPMDMAISYICANQPDKAMDWIEEGFEIHDPQMIYITSGINNLEPLYDNPRFIDIVETMNLALP